jgi:hypothetical protein
VDENVKMFIKVDGRYKLLDLSLRSIRININDSISVPYIQIEYISTGKLPNEYLTEWSNIMQKDFIPVLYCPEKYLPAKLLPIELK